MNKSPLSGEGFFVGTDLVCHVTLSEENFFKEAKLRSILSGDKVTYCSCLYMREILEYC